MAYTPNEWSTGDTITASKLNNMESGIASAAMIITDTGGTLDKTYAEIYNLLNSGSPCYVKYEEPSESLDEDYSYAVRLASVICVMKYSDDYRIYAVSYGSTDMGNRSYVGTPAVWVYQAVNSQSYPSYYAKVYTNSANATCVSYH